MTPFIVRYANTDDIPELLKIGKANFDQMRFIEDGNGWEEDTVTEWLNVILPDETNYINIVADSEMFGILGYFSVILTKRHAWHTGPKHAAELAWHARFDLDLMQKCRTLFALMDTMETLIKERGIKWLHMGCSGREEFKSVHEYLKRRGYRDTDIVMVKEL